MHSYSEVSPSGTGIRVFVRGKLPKGARANHDAGIEVYDSGRYLTVTGHAIDGYPVEVKARQEEIEWLHRTHIAPESERERYDTDGQDPVELARQALGAISPTVADGYWGWLHVGMALKSVSTELLADWDVWSRQSNNYSKGVCAKKWESFNGSGLTIGSLIYWARQNGWKPPKGSAAATNGKAAGSKDQGLIKTLADRICDTNHFAQDAGGKPYRYSAGVYKAKADQYIKRQVKRLCIEMRVDKRWSPHLAESVVEFIRVDAPELWERPPLDVLNIKNGLLRISDKALLSHSPEHLSPVQLPVNYDPNASWPAIEQFVDEAFPVDAHMLVWELAAWLMRPDSSIQKAILLTGHGGNGKSVFLRLLVAFIGKGNTSSLSLHKIESDKFAGARLYGKLANICPRSTNRASDRHKPIQSDHRGRSDHRRAQIQGLIRFRALLPFGVLSEQPATFARLLAGVLRSLARHSV